MFLGLQKIRIYLKLLKRTGLKNDQVANPKSYGQNAKHLCVSAEVLFVWQKLD
jgi:hypothetical protein